MKSMRNKIPYLVLMLVSLVLVACSSDKKDEEPSTPVTMIDYRITVNNLTANQPLSPIAIVMHNDNWRSYTLGSAASVELEQLAESGSLADLITAANSNTDVVVTAMGENPVGPGGSESFDVSIASDAQGNLYLSVVSMLVNTNDAIVVINGNDLSGLEASSGVVVDALTLDAGTEANSETAATIPGPAGGGEGFNATRDDIMDAVLVHSGIVSSQDGLATSVLDGTHKWDNPVMRVLIERIN